MKVSQRNWAEVFGEGNMFAISPVSTFQKVNIVLFHSFINKCIEKDFVCYKNDSLHGKIKTAHEKWQIFHVAHKIAQYFNSFFSYCIFFHNC